MLTFSEIFARSSNIGMVKVAKELGPEQIYKYSRDFGFGSTTGISFPGEAKGILRKSAKIALGIEIRITNKKLLEYISCILNFLKANVIELIIYLLNELLTNFI